MGSSILFDAEWLIIMFLKVLNCLIETWIQKSPATFLQPEHLDNSHMIDY
ncbi:MAG: hypothetical protein ACLVA6_03350 [Dorea sp.]